MFLTVHTDDAGDVVNSIVYASLTFPPASCLLCMQGVLRGCGHQRLTMVFNFLGFWLGGVVLGYVLCFKAGMGLKVWLCTAGIPGSTL